MKIIIVILKVFLQRLLCVEICLFLLYGIEVLCIRLQTVADPEGDGEEPWIPQMIGSQYGLLCSFESIYDFT